MAMLEKGGWAFQGSREDIVIDERASGWQVTRETVQACVRGQYVQRHRSWTLRLRDGDPITIDAPSRASMRELRRISEAMMAGVEIVA